MASGYKTHANSKNIRRRVKILRYIFNIEDSVVFELRKISSINTLGITEIDEIIDKGSVHLFKILKRDAHFNKLLNETFSSTEFHFDKFLENATFTNSINFIDMLKVKYKKRFSPQAVSAKTQKQKFELLIKLRNKVSHSSLMNVDDLMSKLQPTPGSDPNDVNKQDQYEALITDLLLHFQLGFSKISFNV